MLIVIGVQTGGVVHLVIELIGVRRSVVGVGTTNFGTDLERDMGRLRYDGRKRIPKGEKARGKVH